MSKWWGGAVLAIVAGGCVPARDNPNDPAVAPAVRLALVSMEPCGSAEPEEGWPVAATASRGACLAFDARETTDPQGGTLYYTYFIVTSDGVGTEILAERITEDFYEVPADRLRAQFTAHVADDGSDVTPILFGVNVSDATGAKGTASTSALITNSAPVLAAPVPRLLPEGGFPWARGAPMNIELDGSASVDPDRDPRNFCWTTPLSPPFTCDFEGPVWSRSIPTSADRHLFYLDVSDDQVRSEKRTFVVRVGPYPLWSEGDVLRRFDETVRLWTKPNGTRPWFGRGAGGEEWLLLYDGGDKTIAVYRWPELTPTGHVISLGAQSADRAIATPLAGGGTRIWVAARSDLSSIDLKAYDLDETGGSLTPVGTMNVSYLQIRAMDADADGNVVIGGEPMPAEVPVVEFVSADALTRWTIPLALGTSIEGGGVIPETSIFSLSASGAVDDPVDPDDVFGDRIFLFEMLPAGPIEHPVLQGLGPIRRLVHVDNARFWATHLSAGLTLYNRDNLAPLVIVPDILEVNSFLRVDRGTASVHFATASSLVTVDAHGEVSRVAHDVASPTVDFVAASGEIARGALANDVLRISRTLNPDALMSVIDFQPINPERSIVDGGVWAVTSGPAIVRLAEDGTPLEYITELGPDTGDVLLVDPAGVVDPDGRRGWFVNSGVLYRVDFEADRVAPWRAAAVAVPTPPAAAGFYPIGASGPTATAPFAWMWKPGVNPEYGIVDEAGVFDVPLSLVGEAMLGGTGAVVSHRSGDLCVFSRVGMTTQLNHRRISPSGDVSTAVTVLTSSTNGQMGLRSAFTFPEPEVCGVVTGATSTQIFVWDENVSPVADYFELDQLESVTAVAEGVYWASGSPDGSPLDRILTRMVVSSSGALVRETFPVDLTSSPVFIR